MASLPMACLLPALLNGNLALGMDRVVGRGWASGLSHRVLQTSSSSQGPTQPSPAQPSPAQPSSVQHPANIPTTAPLSPFPSGDTSLSTHLTSPPCTVWTVLAFELLSKYPGSPQHPSAVWAPLRMTLTNGSDGEISAS